MTDEFRWPPVVKDPGETLPVALSLFGLCAAFWEANEEYQLGDIVWPIVDTAEGEVSGNGFCYECTQAGRTANAQPKWNTVADEVLAKLDGSVQWTCRGPGLGGISAVSQPVAEPPAGSDISVAPVLVNESTKLMVDYSGGTDGEDYDIKFTFVIGGRQRVGRQTVQVRHE